MFIGCFVDDGKIFSAIKIVNFSNIKKHTVIA